MPPLNELPQLDEMASQPKVTKDSEAANENHATTQEQTKPAKAAMMELKQNARRRKLRNKQKKAKLAQMRKQAPAPI